MSESNLRIAWVSPLPPATSGIADYSADLLPGLSERCAIDLFFDGVEAPEARWTERFRCRSVSELDERTARAFDVVVYQIGNSPPHHAASFRKALAVPGVVVLHETMLHHLVRGITLARGDAAGYREEMRYCAGRSGEIAAKKLLDSHYPVDTWSYPLFERLVDASLGVVVHSRFARDRVLASRPLARVERVPMGIDLRGAETPSIDRAAVRRRLGIAADDVLVASFGFVTPQKRLEPALSAFARVRADDPRARFAIVGEVSPHYELEELLARVGRDGVEVVGRVDATRFADWMEAADIAVNLRHPTGGETSASFLRLLAAGRPVIVNSTGSFAEVPEGACLQVELDGNEVPLLEALLRRLVADPALRSDIGRAARRFAQVEHSLAGSVDGYVRALRLFAGARAPGFAVVPPLAPWPATDPWPALLAAVGSEMADLGPGEADVKWLDEVAVRLGDFR